MARKPRNEYAGSTYHVNIHAVADTVMVRGERDRRALLQTFATVTRRFGWEVLALAILDTHYHLLVRTPEATLGSGMQYLNGTYAQSFNRRHRRKGHLFGDRYWSEEIKTQAHMLATIRYIALNGFNGWAADHPRNDRWNSYPRVLGARTRWHFMATRKLLAMLDTRPQAAFRKLIVLVEGGDIYEERRRRHAARAP